MEDLPHRTDKRKRRSNSPASSPASAPSSPSHLSTPDDDRIRDPQGRKRRRKSSESTARRGNGQVIGDNALGGHARVQYVDTHDQHNVDQRVGHAFHGSHASGSLRVHNGGHYGPVEQRMGHMFESNQASGSARVHYGDQHNHGPVYNNYPGNGAQPRDQSSDQSQDAIARAMESLVFTQMDVRQASVRRAHTNTCKWLFDRPEYNNWRNEGLIAVHNGFFWIKSKPGAGKSTLMKFLFASATKQLPGDTIISFFFNARGEALEKSLDGLYRGLLHQLLTAIPRLQKVLATVASNSVQQDWPLNSLKSLFTQAVMELDRDRVTCFIDALDECPEAEIRDMIEFFEELGESTAAENIRLHICFSSRYYPQVTMNCCQHMSLDGQEGHEEDIAKYVRSKLKVRTGKQGEEIRALLRKKSKGVFMWVVLVVRILNEQSDRGSNNAELRKCLSQIPGELHELFEDILQRGIQDNRYLIPILQWLSFAQRSLTREELYFALRSGDADFNASEPWDPEEDSEEAMDLFILNSSKGLAESTKGKKPTIQFIHESVRDYLRDTGFRSLAPELCQNLEGSSHDYIKNCCLALMDDRILDYLAPPQPLPKAKSEEAKQLRLLACKQFPFLEYAVNSLVIHAESACGRGVPQSGFIASWAIDIWRRFSDIFAIHDTRRFTVTLTAAALFAHYGATNLLKTRINQYGHLFYSGDYYESLRLAVKSGHHQSVTLLLGVRGVEYLSEADRKTLLVQAVQFKDTTILATLLMAGLHQQMPFNTISHVMLQACRADNAKAIQMLLNHGISISNGGDALETAVKHGMGNVVQVLLESGFVVHPDILVKAVDSGSESIVRMLLQYGADVDHVGPEKTALNRACEIGDANFVEILIQHHANVNLADDFGRSPISAACWGGKLPIVRILLANGARVDKRNDQICLDYAFRHRNIGMVQLLLANGANINGLSRTRSVSFEQHDLQDEHPRSLMFVASKVSDRQMLKQLFENGADANVVNGQEYHDALYYACSLGFKVIAHILLSKDSTVTIREAEYYRGLVDIATYRSGDVDNKKAILKLLFERSTGCRAQKRDLYIGTLRRAISNGDGDIADILMENGVSLPKAAANAPPSRSFLDIVL